VISFTAWSLYPRKIRNRHPLDRRLGAPQKQRGDYGKNKFCPCRESNSGRPIHSSTDWTAPTPLRSCRCFYNNTVHNLSLERKFLPRHKISGDICDACSKIISRGETWKRTERKWVFYSYCGESSPLSTAATIGLLYQHQIDDGDRGAIGGMKSSWGNRSSTLFTTNPTWSDPGSNQGHRCGKPATNRLSYGAAHSKVCLNTCKFTFFCRQHWNCCIFQNYFVSIEE
jgi:hypothetical protein